jgi:hypothetical protein
MATELAIPQLAYDKADEIAARYPSDREAAAHIAAEVIAEVFPLILAAELQRMLDTAFPDEDSDYHYGCEHLLDLVRDRASELRGEG